MRAAMAKRKQASERAKRLEVRARILRGVGRVFCWAVCLALGFVVVSTAVPQKRRLAALEAKLEQAKQEQRKTEAERTYHEIEHAALREDPEFLDIRARDPLDYCREGERVLRFPNAK
jgi:cell division protein FtsB